MRLVMMGTGPFAVPTFRSLVASEHDVVALFTQPPRPGKSRKAAAAAENPMRVAASEFSVAVHDPQDINDTGGTALLQSLAADVLVVCDYGQILRPAALAAARLGGINLHGSLLPRHRGAAPVQWALIRGDQETGVTVIHMTPKLDAGPCLVQVRTPIADDEDALTLEARLATLGVDAVHRALSILAAWDGQSPLGQPQSREHVTRAPRLAKQNGEIDWSQPAAAIRNRVRGMVPWPGSFTFFSAGSGGEPQRLILQQLAIVEPSSVPQAAAPGTVVHVSSDALWVLAGDGRAVSLQQVQPAGKRSMVIGEFLRGYRLKPGDRFGGPPEKQA